MCTGLERSFTGFKHPQYIWCTHLTVCTANILFTQLLYRFKSIIGCDLFDCCETNFMTDTTLNRHLPLRLLKVFSKFKALPLVVTFYVCAVYEIGHFGVGLKFHTAKRLAMLNQKGYIV